jgi:UDP-N-acetylmuramate: L-alanyl-gamma-D-glutamyl-meso-diaminopimelate ligase
LQGLRARGGGGRLIALIEPRSNTMRMGEHRARLAESTRDADRVYWFQPEGMDWSLQDVVDKSSVATLASDIDELVAEVISEVQTGDQVVIMSNGSFGGIHDKILAAMEVMA